jgi:hypothetical protein
MSPPGAAATCDMDERSRRGDGIGHPGAKSSASLSATLRRNPFYVARGDRNNFPDLECALQPEPPPYDSSIQSHREVLDEDDDEGSSILNMSIGARASLNEHLRHVERFGIDGEKVIGSSNVRVGRQEDLFTETDSDILDDHWNNLLNSSRLDSSSSVTGVTASSPLSRLDNILHPHPAVASEESIEVLADTSQDFFNSSRIHLLATPDRNQNRRLDMVTTRDEVRGEDALFDNSLCDSDANSTECYLTRYAKEQHINQSTAQGGRLWDSGLDTSREADRNSSFQSLNPVELSRISNACSEVNQTPDTSFRDGALTTDDGFLDPIIGGGYSPARNVDSSFHSTPTKREVKGKGFGSVNRKHSGGFPAAATVPVVLGRCSLHGKQRMDGGIRQKENLSPDISTNNSVQSTMSSIMAEARLLMKNVANEVELTIGALDNFPSDFLKAIDFAGRPSETPSPISQVGSTTSSSQEKSSNCGAERPSQHAISTAHDVPLTGRKRFRTVVPRRVYLDSAATYDEEHDSFLAVQSNPETARSQKSQREVVEAAMRHTF